MVLIGLHLINKCRWFSNRFSGGDRLTGDNVGRVNVCFGAEVRTQQAAVADGAQRCAATQEPMRQQ